MVVVMVVVLALPMGSQGDLGVVEELEIQEEMVILRLPVQAKGIMVAIVRQGLLLAVVAALVKMVLQAEMVGMGQYLRCQEHLQLMLAVVADQLIRGLQ
jgi:hypothetical protein